MAVCSQCGRQNTDDARFCSGCAAPLAATLESQEGREVRKVVTILRCDVVGSTALGGALDPEPLRRLMGRYFDEIRAILERHGGTVEKFIGDAVMAVFGIPQAHEDDALRAVRAAVDVRDALSRLNAELERERGLTIEFRTAVNTGEVVAGSASGGERFATGDPVNLAQRLEAAAEPGSILIGEQTYRLARDHVLAEALPDFVVKGKTEPVRAWRLVELLAEVPAFERPIDSPFVGRDPELAELESAFRRAAEERCCVLATVVGEPGIGKSRLARELVASLGAEARLVVGRCLPYGEGITYWPLADVVRQVAGADPQSGLEELFAEHDDGALVAERIAGALGVAGAEGRAEETPWAFRRLFEALARDRPLLAVIDDIHWAEPPLLDLLEYIVGFSRTIPVLLLCLARPGLLESRPSWDRTGLVALEPLPDLEARELIDSRAGELPAPTRDAVVRSAEGNPLFIEQLLAARAEGGDVEVPPSIQALLEARIDSLETGERAVVECASVEGRLFHRGAIAVLLPMQFRTELGAHLMSLVRKELIRPDRTIFRGDDGFRFHHVLIRDAAYSSIRKEERAVLHERFAHWLDGKGDEVVERDELVGYHLEQAYRYRFELGPADGRTRALAEQAAERLAAAGGRASRRWDLRAAIVLLDRAVSLLPKEDPRRVELLPELGTALCHAQELTRAEAVLTEAIETATAAGDVRSASHAVVASLDLQLRRHPEEGTATIEEGLRGAIRAFEELDDERGLAQAWLLVGVVERSAAAVDAALVRALEYARNAGDTKAEAFIRIHYALALLGGPAPLAEVRRYQQANLEWAKANRSLRVEAASLVLGGRLCAMRGEFDDGRALIERGRSLFEQLGIEMALVAVRGWAGEVEELAGDLAAAEREFRAALEISEATGDRRRIPYFAFTLARLADLQGRYDEAAMPTAIYDEYAAGDDPGHLEAIGRCWRARVLARQGHMDEAVRFVNEAIALAPPREDLLDRCSVLVDAAEVLSLAGRVDAAASTGEEALRLYEQKGSVVAAAKARSMLESLGAASPA